MQITKEQYNYISSLLEKERIEKAELASENKTLKRIYFWSALALVAGLIIAGFLNK